MITRALVPYKKVSGQGLSYSSSSDSSGSKGGSGRHQPCRIFLRPFRAIYTGFCASARYEQRLGTTRTRTD
eukprot:scaffold586372_cov13-Prasinocladus_malaysianus.AAC.1